MVDSSNRTTSPVSAFETYRAEVQQALHRLGVGRVRFVDEPVEQGRIQASDIEDVLLVGGSTLLPGFFSWFEERFERSRVRAWQPFEAVAYGAAAFAGDRMNALDFIVYDYACP